VKIVNANNESKIFSQLHFKKVIGDYWYNICSTLYQQGLDTRKHFTQSPLVKMGCVSSVLQVKFHLKYGLGLNTIVQKKKG